jgi:hypothetical protein
MDLGWMAPGSPGGSEKKEPALTGEMKETTRKQTVSALTDIPWQDGMKTEETIKGYDPFANPLDNPLQNKTGDNGGSEYDYSKSFTSKDNSLGG